MVSKRLFVGGLPYSVSNSQLEEMFAKFGEVISAVVISDKFTGRSKGFGFVEMADEKQADEAIESLNQSKLEGRTIVVNLARPIEERKPRRFDSGGRRFIKDRRQRRSGSVRGGRMRGNFR